MTVTDLSPRLRGSRAASVMAAVLLLALASVPHDAAAETPGRAAARCAPGQIVVLTERGATTYAIPPEAGSVANERAETPEDRARGLMQRERLAPDAGMLFLYDRPEPRRFWMRDTLIPLDIVFVDARGQVLNVVADTVPHSEQPLPSDGAALAVLEVNAGEAVRHGIEPGTQLVHPHFVDAPSKYRC